MTIKTKSNKAKYNVLTEQYLKEVAEALTDVIAMFFASEHLQCSKMQNIVWRLVTVKDLLLAISVKGLNDETAGYAVQAILSSLQYTWEMQTHLMDTLVTIKKVDEKLYMEFGLACEIFGRYSKAVNQVIIDEIPFDKKIYKSAV